MQEKEEKIGIGVNVRLLIMACVLTLAAAVGGCGSDDASVASDPTSGGKPGAGSSLARCLEARGADFATSAAELDFFTRARDRDDALDTGVTYDRDIKGVVDEWRQAPDADSGPPWVVWTAQPISQRPLSVEEVAERSGKQYFVAYVHDASKERRESAMSCIDYDKLPRENEDSTPRYDPPPPDKPI